MTFASKPQSKASAAQFAPGVKESHQHHPKSNALTDESLKAFQLLELKVFELISMAEITDTIIQDLYNEQHPLNKSAFFLPISNAHCFAIAHLREMCQEVHDLYFECAKTRSTGS